jgi:transposase
VIELIQQEPRSIVALLAQFGERTGKRVSESTLQRFLKAAGYSWKRIKKTMTDRRDHEAFEAAQAELQDLKEQHRQGEIELWFEDRSGF